MTGPALEHMLHLGDVSLLETVMGNVVVLSRTKPHQKGQILTLQVLFLLCMRQT